MISVTYRCHEIYCGATETRPLSRHVTEPKCVVCNSPAVTCESYVFYDGHVWGIEQTGGGCTAYMRYEGDRYFMLTHSEGAEIPQWGMPAVIGEYAEEDSDPISEYRHIAAFEPERPATAIEIAQFEARCAYQRALRQAEAALRSGADSVDEILSQVTGTREAVRFADGPDDIEGTLRHLAGECWQAMQYDG